MKGKELVKLLKKNGWTVDRMHGSHCVMKKGRQTETIPVHNTDLPPAGFSFGCSYLASWASVYTLAEKGLNE